MRAWLHRLAAWMDSETWKGLQALQQLLTWTLGALLLVGGLLVWFEAVTLEPDLRDLSGDHADTTTAVLRAQFVLEAKARHACRAVDVPRDDHWLRAHAHLGSMREHATVLEGWSDLLLDRMPTSPEAVAWRVSLAWALADNLSVLQETTPDAAFNAALQQRACAALDAHPPHAWSMDSILLTRVVLANAPAPAGDAPPPAAVCDALAPVETLVASLQTDTTRLRVVVFGRLSLPGPEVPLDTTPDGPATALLHEQLAAVCAVEEAAGDEPLWQSAFDGLEAALRADRALLTGIHAAVAGGPGEPSAAERMAALEQRIDVLVRDSAACDAAAKATRQARRKLLKRALGVGPSCRRVDPNGRVPFLTGDDSTDTVSADCQDVCGNCPQPGLPGRRLHLEVQSAAFDDCAVEASGPLAPVVAVGSALAGDEDATLELVGWADHRAPSACADSNLRLAADRAELVARSLIAPNPSLADQVTAAARAQPAHACHAGRCDGSAGADALHARWRRVDVLLDGGALTFDPRACEG